MGRPVHPPVQGPCSVFISVFGLSHFGVPVVVLKSGLWFRTGWFLESVVSAALIVLVVRTRGRLLSTPPSTPLAIATACAVVTALALPFTPIAPALGFSAVPPSFVAVMAVIVGLYVVAAEVAKRYFYRLPLFRGELQFCGRRRPRHRIFDSWARHCAPAGRRG